MATVTLVNLNLVRVPAIGPYAIDVLGSALEARGHQVSVLDLTREADGIDAIDRYFAAHRPDILALSMRNHFDLYFPSLGRRADHGSFLASHARVIEKLKRHASSDRIVIGGVGFSTAPFQLLERFGLHTGVRGPGEEVLPLLCDAVDRGLSFDGMKYPKLERGKLQVFDGRRAKLSRRVRRKFVDNRWYYEYGGLGNLRASSGCSMRCGYCVEPYAKGGSFSKANVENILLELDELVEMGIYDVQTADSEFNMPLPHSKQLLRGIIERRYPKQFRLWAYIQPSPFDAEYAELLAQAGVPGVNVGTDHTDPTVLAAMNKWFTLQEVAQMTKLCRSQGIAVMHELLFGYPGDNPEKMYRALDDLRALDPTVIGVTIGMGVLEGTALGNLLRERLSSGAPLDGFHLAGEPFVEPAYFVDPSFRIPEVYSDLEQFVGKDVSYIMIPKVNAAVDTDNQLVDSERIRAQLHEEKKKGAYWFHYAPTRAQLHSARS